VTVEFNPPVAVTFPFRVAVVSSTLVAGLMVTVSGTGVVAEACAFSSEYEAV
jgi:hypothetical protein